MFPLGKLHDGKAVAAAANPWIEMNMQFFPVAKALQPRHQGAFAVALYADENAPPQRDRSFSCHPSTEGRQYAERAAAIESLEIRSAPQTGDVADSIRLCRFLPVFLDNEQLLLFQIVEQGEIMQRTDQQGSVGIGVRAAKPVHNLHCKIGMKIGIEGVHDDQAAGLQRKIQIGKHQRHMARSRRLRRQGNS